MIDGMFAIRDEARAFEQRLKNVKESISQEPGYWYPYRILSMFEHIDFLLKDTPKQDFFSGFQRATIADIGTADGDLAYFLESLGHTVDAVDYSMTRGRHGLEPTRRLGAAIGSSVITYDINLDAQFSLPRQRYDLAFFMGILYHLKNPYYALEKLSAHTKYCFLSTRIARFTPNGAPMKDESLAYLLDSQEANGDKTNYWIFSETGLKRLISRTGWNVLAFSTRGETRQSNPRDNEHDERAYCLLQSQRVE